MTDQTYEPTAGGNTGIVYSKKGLANKKAREAKAKKLLWDWNKTKDIEIEVLQTFGAVHIGHPKEKPFGGQKGQTITVKEVDFEALKKAGYARKVK